MAWCIDLFSGWMGPTSTCSFWCPDPSDRSFWKCRAHVHTMGHFARRKTFDQIQRRAYWPAWKTDTKLYCECCRACNEFHGGKIPKQAKLKPMFAGAPMEVLHVDLTGPHVNSRGCSSTYADYADELHHRMTGAYGFVRQHPQEAARRSKRYYDMRVRPQCYSVDDWLDYFNPRKFVGRQDKWRRKHSGPFLSLIHI